MESFMRLASDNLSLQYQCGKCASELGLSDPVGLSVKSIKFNSVQEDLIEIRPLTSIRRLCGALGSKLRIGCRACKAKLGYRIDTEYEINTEAINIVLGEVQLQLVSELAAEDHEVHSAMEEIVEPDEFCGLTRTDLVHKLRENVRVKADMEIELDRMKEENRGLSSIIKDLEGQNNKSAERYVFMIRKIEYLNTKIERMKEENKKFKSIVGSENLKVGERAVAFMKKIEKLNTDIENMNEKRKESEEQMRKGREKNLSLFLKMEKMKQRIRERECEFKLEMECVNISLQRAKVKARNEPEKESLVLDSQKNKEVLPGL